MKKRLSIAMLILLTAAVSVIGTACQKKEPTTNKDNTKKETELIFSFESYKDIVGTKLWLKKQFGATKVNTDSKYITDGKGSWMLQPQGNYANKGSGADPYFTLECEETTFLTNDFLDYDKVMLDVYNDSEEEVTIRWCFKMNNFLGDMCETPTKEFKLGPKAWTTCEYDITDETYGTYYWHDSVQSMTVYFPDRKESRDDEVYTLYMDNLRGHITDTPRFIEELDTVADMSEGITFENEKDHYQFSSASSGNNKFGLSRVAYSDSSIAQANDSMGEYCLKGDATGAIWPAFQLNYGDIYDKGTLLTFWAYIEVDETKVGDATYFISSYVSETDRTEYEMLTSECKFNQWVQVSAILPNDASTTWTFFNLDANVKSGGVGTSWFGDDVQVTIYMDNFQIGEYDDGATVKADGSLVLKNPYNKKILSYVVKHSVKKGQIVSFDVDVTPAQAMAVWVLGDDKWEDEYYAKAYVQWTGVANVMVEMPEDTEYFEIVVQFREEGKTDFKENEVTISNVSVVDPSSTVTIVNKNGAPSTSYTFNKAVKAGQIITFDIDIKPAQGVSIWLLGDATWEKEYYAKEFTAWGGNTTLAVEIPANIKSFQIFVKYNESDRNLVGNTVVISNVNIRNMVKTDTIKKLTFESVGHEDMISATNGKRVAYKDTNISNSNSGVGQYGFSYRGTGEQWPTFVLKYNNTYGKGKVLTFQIYVEVDERASGGLTYHLESFYNRAQKKANTVTFSAFKFNKWQTVNIVLQGDATDNYAFVNLDDGVGSKVGNFPVTVYMDNIQIIDYDDGVDVNADQSVTLRNPYGTTRLEYRYHKALKAGSTVDFDIDVTPAQHMAVWLIGNDGVEYHAHAYATWAGKRTISVPITKDIDNFKILVEFRDNAFDFSKNTVTISNVKYR